MRRGYDEEEQDINRQQRHTHEYLGSTEIDAPQPDLLHNHNFAGVTGEAIIYGQSHYHKLEDNTDFTIGHYHIVADRTSLAIPVDEGRHVHFVEGETTVQVGHRHDYRFTTLIEDPNGEQY